MRVKTFAALVLLAFGLSGQETRGRISGTVVDTSSAVVAGATVVVTNLDTANEVQIATNANGYYEAPLLLPGKYQVSVQAPGFKKFTRSNLALGLGGELLINCSLEVGAASESVTVTGEAPILDTSAVTYGKVLTTRELMDLPVIANNIILQSRMAPGVATSGTTQYLSEGMIGGSSTSYFAPGGVGGNEWTVDGQPNVGSSRNTAFTPHTDMVGEFKVEADSFDASFGHSTGLNISMSTKSGANQFHGTATEEYWSQEWAAAPYFIRQTYLANIRAAQAAGNTALANQLKAIPEYPPGHSNNFSGTLMGPVIIPKLLNGRNRLFFFFAYSGARDDIPARATDINDTVPTVPERTGDFSDLLGLGAQYTVYDPLTVQASGAHYVRTPFPGNVVPQSRIINPMYNFYLAKMPLPNVSIPAGSPPLTNFRPNCQPDNNRYNALENRTDFDISSKSRLFFRWNWSHYQEFYGDLTCSGLLTTDDTRQNVSGIIDYTYTQSAATVWDISVAANQWFQRGSVNPGLTKYKPSDVGLPSYVDQLCLAHADCQMPTITLAGSYYFYNGTSFGRGLSTYPYVRSQGVKLNVSHILGTHTFRGGVDFRDQVRNDVGYNGNSAGIFTFDNSYTQQTDGQTPAAGIGLPWAAFMLGLPSNMSIDNNTSVSEVNPYYGFYGQDSWRLGRKLTLNIGLRVEYETGPTERYNRAIGAFDPSAQLPIAAAAQAAYASSPIAAVPASSFVVQGGDSYVGVNGNTRKLWQNQLMFLPRVAGAYQLGNKTVLRAGYGIYYDTLNVLNEAASQPGFSCTTNNPTTTNSGLNWLEGNPAAGISPLTDPFPVQSNGSRICTPYGSSLGSMYQVGRGWTFTPYDREHPRVQKWRASIQRQLSPNMVVEASYWGQWGDDLGVTHRLDALPAQYWATGLVRNQTLANNLTANVSNPFTLSNFTALQSSNLPLYQYMSTLGFYTSKTIQYQQLIRQYPQMNGISESNTPIGRDRIKSLEVDFQRRLSRGFNVNASWSWIGAYDKLIMSNEFDPVPTWYPSNNARPERVTINGILEIPFGKNRQWVRTGVPSYILGGWQVSATWEYQSGDLLSFPNIYYYGDFNQLASQLNSVPRTINQWFNTNAPFEHNSANQPASYSVRVFPQYINGVRGPELKQLNANLRRDFRFKERLNLQLRMDMYNVFNRSQFSDPDTNPNDGSNFGKITGQTASQNRFIQIQGRIQF